MTERVTLSERGYQNWPELPADVEALLPQQAKPACAEYERLVRRRREVAQALTDADDRSAAMLDARDQDRQAALVAMRKGEPAPTPVHRPALLQRRAALELERDNLPVVANEVLGQLDAALRAAQPKMVNEAFANMNRVLGDERATWKAKLDAVAQLAWVAHVHETLHPPFVPEYAMCEQAALVLAHEPSEAGRRVVEAMPQPLRRRLATDKVMA